MKTIVFSRILIIFTTLVVTGSLFAQASSDLDSYSERLRLENELKQNIESIVSTQLDRDTFEIGVSLSIEKVSKAPEAIRKTEDNSDFYPSDLNLGILDIGKVIDSYEDELEKERKKQEEQQGPEYQIKSLDVLVGLHQKYGEEYFKAFESWISDYSKKNLFSSASVKVFKIKEAKVEKPKEPKGTGFEGKSIYEKLKDFQWLVGGVIALLLFLFISLFRDFLRGRRELKQKKLELQHLSDLEDKKRQAEQQESEPEDDFEEEDEISSDGISDELYQQLCIKTTKLFASLGQGVETLLNYWLNEDRDGTEKLTILFDAVHTSMLRLEEKEAIEIGNKLRSLSDVYKPYMNELKDSFDSLMNIELDEHIEILKSIYWEMLKLSTLGVETIKQPFDFLNSMSPQELELIMNGQDLQTRSLVLLHMNSTQQKSYIDKLEFNEIKDIVSTSLEHVDVDTKIIEDVETAVKVVSKSIEKADVGSKLNLLPKTVKILEALPVSKEIKVLRDLRNENAIDVNSLGSVFLTFAFLDLWKKDMLSLFVKRFSTEEVTSLIRILPESREQILEVCSDRVRQIVSDNLQIDSIETESQLATKIAEMKKKVYSLMGAENITLDSIYVEQQEVRNAA